MNVYKHTAVSFAASALLFIALRKIQVSIACFLSGVLIDFDHVFDYCANRDLSEKLGYLRHPRKLLGFLSVDYNKHKPYEKTYKLIHSMELLIPILILYAFGIRNEIIIGILIGFLIHLIMDSLVVGHIGSVSLIYKISSGFPRGSELMKRRLSRAGRDVNKCQICNARGETVLCKRQRWYTGFTKKELEGIKVLCPDCHQRIDDEKE